MPYLETFISSEYRPDIRGGRLDKKHQSRTFLLDKKEINSIINVNSICFGPKKDNVLLNLEHAICAKDNILVFYYEDIHVRWTYLISDKQKYFIYKKNDEEEYIIKPKKLYIRSCYLEPHDQSWRILGDFFNFVNIWDGYVLCSPKNQVHNESKPFQLNNSLLTSSIGLNKVSIGRSYIIKGKNKLNRLNNKKSYVVKSISGIRSLVVDSVSYDFWDKTRINNIPVLFQEKADGDDLRVHVVNNKTFSKLAVAKKNVDYRYDSSFFNLVTVSDLDENLQKFCIKVCAEEDNLLLGVDFIKNGDSYFVLEANPSPGWSAYHDCNGVVVDPFIQELISFLKK